jgi:hypothetical protein
MDLGCGERGLSKSNRLYSLISDFDNQKTFPHCSKLQDDDAVLHGGPRFILAVSSSSLGRLLLGLRTSWTRKTLTLFAFTTSLAAVASLSCLSSNTSFFPSFRAILQLSLPRNLSTASVISRLLCYSTVISTCDLVLGSIIYHDVHPREEYVPALRYLGCRNLLGTLIPILCSRLFLNESWE